MAEIINLRRARKARDKAAHAAEAATARALHGLTRAERVGAEAAADRHRRFLDGVRRDGDEPA